MPRARMVMAVVAALAAMALGLNGPARPAAAQGPKPLTVVHGSEPRSLNPNVDTIKTSLNIANTVLDTLLTTDEQFRPAPGLAESWQRVDPRTWRFKLRRGVTFHNGEPFNAAAVVFSVKNPGRFGPYFKTISDAVAVDPQTVEFKTASPTSVVPALMTSLWILPPVHYAKVGEQEFGRHPVGTGPFRFEEWVPGQRISVVKADRAWGRPAAVPRVVWRWATEASARVALLETGEADLLVNVAPQLIDRIDKGSAGKTVSVRSLRKLFVAFNMFDPNMQDVRVRKAAAHAIDREAITQGIFGGKAVADSNVLNSVFKSAGSHGSRYFNYDPATSKRLLAEAGFNRPVTLHSTLGRYLLDKEAAEAVAGMLEAGGFQVKRNPLEAGAFFNLLFDRKLNDMHLTGIAPLYPHEDIIMRTRFYSTSISKYCADDTLDKMVDEAFGVDNEEQRARAYNRIEAYILFDKVCWVPLYDLVDVYAVSTRLQGFQARSDETIEFAKLTLR
jgi:peptide/nickel transport system substrate-binding protein